MKKISIIIFLMLSILCSISIYGKEDVSLTFLGNAGILVESKGLTLVHDGIFTHSYGRNQVPPENIISLFEQGRNPFRGRLILTVSHSHFDHIDPVLVGKHLSREIRTSLVAGSRVCNFVEDYYDRSWKSGDLIDLGIIDRFDVEEISVKGIDFTVLSGYHHQRNLYNDEHLSYFYELEQINFLYMGCESAELSDVFQSMLEQNISVDVALLPKWFIEEEAGLEMIEKLNCKTVILHHLYMDEVDHFLKITENLPADFPEVFIMETPGTELVCRKKSNGTLEITRKDEM